MRRITASLRGPRCGRRARCRGRAPRRRAPAPSSSSSCTSPDSELALAGAAVAGLAGERERAARRAAARRASVSPASTGTGSAVALQGDLHAPHAELMVSSCLDPKQMLQARACCPGCSATACALAQQAVFRDFARARRRGFAGPRRHPAADRGESGRDAEPPRAGGRASTARPWSACSTRSRQRGLVERRRGEDRRTNGPVADARRARPGRRASSGASRCTSGASRRGSRAAERAQLLALLEKLAG